jgi:hypothetical protein
VVANVENDFRGHMDAAFDGHLVQRLTLTLDAR